jgi:hypothetical protein
LSGEDIVGVQNNKVLNTWKKISYYRFDFADKLYR